VPCGAMWLAFLIRQLKKLNVFITSNEPSYIVCKLEKGRQTIWDKLLVVV